MTVNLSMLAGAGAQFFDNNGVILSGGLIYTYAAGTTTPQAAYTTSSGSTAHTNPIVLDSAGRVASGGEIWLTDAVAYKFVLKTSAAITIGTYDNVTGNASGVAAGIYSTFAASSGSSLVGYLPTGANAVATTVQSKLRNIVQVNDFVSGGLGTSASPWTGWDTNIIWASSNQYNFIDGYYSYATSPNFAKDYLCLDGSAGAVIRHTGSGYALLCDAGSGAQLVTSVSINIRLEGNASSTGGIYQRGCVHSTFKCKFHNVPLVCFTDIFGVLNTYTLETSALIVGQSIVPTNLINIDKRGAADISSANKYYLIAENTSSVGVVLSNCVNSVFISGTSETNTGAGLFISSTSNYNTFLNFDLEANVGYDISCSGSYNNFIGILSSGLTTMNGSHNTIVGGIYDVINSGGTQNSFGPLSYSAKGGAFTETGTGNTKKNVFNVTSSIMDLDVYSPILYVKTGSGSVTAANNTATTLFAIPGTGMYQIFVYITSGDAANYASSAVVLQEGGGARRITANNGTSLALTLSGANVQANQTSGVSQTINYSYLRIN